MLFRWRKIWEVCTKEERKREEAMKRLAQAGSADRHRQEEYNKQTNKKKMATEAIRKGCEYWRGGSQQ